MRAKLYGYLDLVRVPNLFTAVADVLAGYLYAGGRLQDWETLLPLGLASACLYAAGVALNDVHDASDDAQRRPRRPIPFGRVSRRSAIILCAIFFTVGLGLTATVSARAIATAGGLVAAIFLYDIVLKSTSMAPVAMGLCRALNLMLGMSVHTLSLSAALIVPALLIWLYVASLTYFARHEAGESYSRRLIAGTVGICFAVIGLAALPWIVVGAHSSCLLLVAALAVVLGYNGIKAAREQERARTQHVVSLFVCGIVLMDACIVWASRGPLIATSVAFLLVPTLFLRKWFRMT